MRVACCSIRFYIHEAHSLKEKRRVAKSIKDRLKNKFNVAVSEIGDQDIWQSLHLGIVSVGPDSQYLDGLMNKLISAIELMHLAEITDSRTQILTMDPAWESR